MVIATYVVCGCVGLRHLKTPKMLVVLQISCQIFLGVRSVIISVVTAGLTVGRIPKFIFTLGSKMS